MTHKEIGALLAKARKAKGYSQKEVASYLNIRIATLNEVERGNRDFQIGTMLEVLNFLNLKVEIMVNNAKHDQDALHQIAEHASKKIIILQEFKEYEETNQVMNLIYDLAVHILVKKNTDYASKHAISASNKKEELLQSFIEKYKIH